ncbi:MAG: esterase-like activity of phytase family protein, partial [Geodermatophilaceae bacterium]|nr:esterase-like activity of phytase family protein [Geodermatophilaceae bacterium]
MMFQFLATHSRRRAAMCAVAAACGLNLSIAPAAATPADLGPTSAPVFIGEEILPTGLMFEGTEVGGLSGLAYDAALDVYYAISDDRSQLQPARFYTLQIDLSAGALDDGDVAVIEVTTLRDPRGRTFAPLSLDPESIALTPRHTLIVTSEG